MTRIDLGQVVPKATIYKKEGNVLCYERDGILHYRGRHYVTEKVGYIDLPSEFNRGTVVSVQATPSTSSDFYFVSAFIEGNRIKYTLNQLASDVGLQIFFQAEKYI